LTEPGRTASSTTSEMGHSAKRTQTLSSAWFGDSVRECVDEMSAVWQWWEGSEMSDEMEEDGSSEVIDSN